MSTLELFDRRLVLGMAAAAAATAPFLSAPPAAQPPDPRFANRRLRQIADAKGLLCGTEVNSNTLASDPRVGASLRADANIVVPDVELKWSVLQPQRDGPLQFDRAEAIYAFARAHDIAMRGHTLTWYRAEPSWAAALIPTLSAGAAGDVLTDYVGRVVGHWRGRVLQWDVANEPIDGSGALTEPLFSARLGEQYLDLAFHAAHAADPHALLMLNTDLIEQDAPYQERHRRATLGLLERLVKRGVPIGALGVESHLTTMASFSEALFRRFLEDVSALGLKIMLTEFDVLDKGTLGLIPQRDAAVAALGKAYLDVAFGFPNCLGMLAWGQSDRYSWLRQPSPKQRSDGAPLRPDMLDDDFRRKPLWYAVAAALAGAPARG